MLRRGAFFVRHLRCFMRSYHDDVPVIGTPQDTKSSTFQVRIILSIYFSKNEITFIFFEYTVRNVY